MTDNHVHVLIDQRAHSTTTTPTMFLALKSFEVVEGSFHHLYEYDP